MEKKKEHSQHSEEVNMVTDRIILELKLDL